jgi:hypothetical protein
MDFRTTGLLGSKTPPIRKSNDPTFPQTRNTCAIILQNFANPVVQVRLRPADFLISRNAPSTATIFSAIINGGSNRIQDSQRLGFVNQHNRNVVLDVIFQTTSLANEFLLLFAVFQFALALWARQNLEQFLIEHKWTS